MKRMRVLQTIAGMDVHGGGTTTCTYSLMEAMNTSGASVDLLTLEGKLAGQRILGSGKKWMKALPNDALSPLEISRGMKKFLLEADYDLYHTNGLWLYCNHVTCAVARKMQKPYLITPHGMLYPEAIQRSYWKKWMIRKILFDKDIHHAACIHVTCKQEMEFVRQFGYEGPIAVIPNPSDTIPCGRKWFEIKKTRFLTDGNPRRFGFLGRLHPIKNIEVLLYALNEISMTTPCHLVIMGKGDDNYERFLREETERLNLVGKVSFMGFVDGDEKNAQLAGLSALFLPSDSENFGMVVIESLAVGTPVMASLGTPWESLETSHCGWWRDANPKVVASVMKEVAELPVLPLLEMGERGIALAKTYNADNVASEMLHLYGWLCGHEYKPEFLYFD